MPDDLARSYLVSRLCDTRIFCRNQNIITFCEGSRVSIGQFMRATVGMKYKNIISERLLNPFDGRGVTRAALCHIADAALQLALDCIV